MKPTIPLDYVAEVLNESGKRFYISEYIWSKHGGDCKYRKGEETYEVVEETVDTVTEVVQDGVTVQQPGTVTATATRKVE